MLGIPNPLKVPRFAARDPYLTQKLTASFVVAAALATLPMVLAPLYVRVASTPAVASFLNIQEHLTVANLVTPGIFAAVAAGGLAFMKKYVDKTLGGVTSQLHVGYKPDFDIPFYPVGSFSVALLSLFPGVAVDGLILRPLSNNFGWGGFDLKENLSMLPMHAVIVSAAIYTVHARTKALLIGNHWTPPRRPSKSNRPPPPGGTPA